jgi:hypothetical protein
MTSPPTDSTLHAHRAGFPRNFEILDGTAPITTISARTVRRGGRIEIDGQPYQVERTGLAQHYRLSSMDGHPVAAASRTLPRGWDIEVGGGRMLRMTRATAGSREVLLDDTDRQVGEIRRVVRGVEAELPGLDHPSQVFVLIVALASRERRRRAVVLAR